MQVVDKIWVPDSFTDKLITSINRAVRNYDERLFFGRNETNGDWVVFIKMPHGEDPIPVLGFQNRMPDPDKVIKKLMECDTKRHGDYILDKMNADNERLRKEQRKKVEEAEWMTAETMESFLHRQGKAPYHRSLRKRDPKQRGG